MTQKNNDTALYLVTKGGRVNPLKKGDKLPFSFVLDSSFDTGFNFTKEIKEHEHAWQSYKIIIVAHYNHNSLTNIKNQRFEYLYRVRCYDGSINGEIDEFPNKMNDAKLIYKEVPYEL